MTWQDELKALDEKLAAGALSAEGYRQARDQILAQYQTGASGGQQQSQQQSQQQGQPQQGQPNTPPPGVPQQYPNTPPPGLPQQYPNTPPPGFQQQYNPQQGQATQYVQPQSQQQGQGPFPPPFQWSSSQPQQSQQPPADSTQIIPAIAAGQQPQQGTPERTQIVRPSGPDSDPEHTQVVRGQQHSPERTQIVQPQAYRTDNESGGTGSPWAADSDLSAPPWASGDFEPVPTPDQTWLRQGPEAFETKSSKTGRMVGMIVAAVLVVGVAIAAIVYFTNKGPGDDNAGPPPATTTAPTSTTPSLPDAPPVKAAPADTSHALIDPPGTPRAGGGQFNLASLTTAKLLPKEMTDALGTAGMTDAVLKTSVDNGNTLGMYALTVRSEADASTAASVYARLQREGGLPSDDKQSYRGVPVFSTPAGGKSQVTRAVYVLYNRVIIVEVFGTDSDTAAQEFKTVLDQQLALAPPSVRKS